MRIIHYSLGFPPYRTGGMTKFCIDLMEQQNRDGHQVAMLWPGQMRVIEKTVSIKDRGNIHLNGEISNIRSFEVINPLPVSYDEGIADFSEFTKDVETSAYLKLLKKYTPNVIHVHTLMGLHKSFLEVAKEMRIQLVFTTHDFFPICPKITMFRHGRICACVQSCEECGVCNTTALSMKKIIMLQSPLYRILKDSAVVKKLRKKHRDNYLSESTLDDQAVPVGEIKNFQNLRKYYGELLRMMDMVHFNSTVAKAVYEKVFDLPDNCVIGISHLDVADHKKIKLFCNNILRIRYLGPYGRAKGFFLLKAALDKLWSERKDFRLDIHFTLPELPPYIQTHERYDYSELERIFDDTDVLIVPSIWYETFGYTVLEALSYGVPVVMSGTVGAKDILSDGAGIVIEDLNSDKLYEKLRDLSMERLRKMNRLIIERQNIVTLKNMSMEIEKKCYCYRQGNR